MNLLVLRFLTMNTEDEKRDEQQAELARKGLVRVREPSDESDDEHDPYALPLADNISVCSCSCYRLPYGRRESVRRRQSALSSKVQQSQL